MEIIDAQVHLNMLLPNWRTVDLDEAVAAGVTVMDAVGIDRLLIAESWGFDAQMRPARAAVLPNGAIRMQFPFSERAVALHPDRFVSLRRVDHRDPELERLVSEVRATPGALCLRVVPIVDTGEVDAFERGEFEPLFAAAEQHAVPIFASLHGRGHMLVRYLRNFPRLQVILDHTGVGVDPPRIGTVAPTLARSVVPSLEGRIAQLDAVIELAQYPNLALKWCHAPARLSAERYPHRDVLPHLRRVIEAYGVERVMWASDFTQSFHTFGRPWAESLHYLLDSDQLSETEKEWLFGRSVRQVLRWRNSASMAEATSLPESGAAPV
jgi:predicted TIM-barrel fold metal-dependent hydrolase